MVIDFFQFLLHEQDSISCLISSGISAIVSDSTSVLPLVWWRFFLEDLACPSFSLWWKGVQNFIREFFDLYQGIFSLPSLYHDGEGINGLLDCTQRFPISWGFSKSLESTAPRLRATSREFWTFPSVFLVSWQRRSWRAVYLISDGIFGLAFFPFVIWGREDKIEVIQEIVMNVPQVFYYRSTLSRSGFEKCHMR